MAIATGSRHSLHYVAESTYGTTPATPAWKHCPFTGVSLGLTKDNLESQKLSSDRQVKDVRHGNRQVGGNIDGEFEYGAFDDLLEAMAMGTWTDDVLKAGTTRRSFSFERFFDLDVNEYHRYTGCELNSMSLSVQPNQIVGVTFGVIGQDMSINATQVAGSTYAAAVDNRSFDSFTGEITEGGVTNAVVTQIEMQWENGIEPIFVIGSRNSIRPGDGKSRLTGTLTAFYESKAMYEKYVNETASSLVLSLEDPDGNVYSIALPNVTYTSGNPDVSGEGNVTVGLQFSAIYSQADLSQIVITRTPAV